jgi:hypothetical protein
LIAIGPVFAEDTAEYVRPDGDKFTTECQFAIAKDKSGWNIVSRTFRGKTEMKITARFDSDNRLTDATAELRTNNKLQTATVRAKDGKAVVHGEAAAATEFEAPKGIIVTSAPDWADVFLLCRFYDRQRQGKQEFPGLWIHPAQTPQRLIFTIERRGTDRIEHDGRMVELDRYLIRIRNNSEYAAWADTDGRMIRLIPLPSKEGNPGLTLKDYEKSAAGLRP